MLIRLAIISLEALFLVSVVQATSQKTYRTIDMSRIPLTGNTVKDFVPHGWVIEEQYEGDLNADSKPDVVLRLIEAKPKNNTDGTPNELFRALIVLFRTDSGKLERAGVGPRLIYCTICGGALGDPEGGNISIVIQKGVLSVSQLSGSRESTDLTLRFRFDSIPRRFVMIGKDVETTDRIEGTTTLVSTNYLTGLQLEQNFKYDANKDAKTPLSTKRTRVPLQKKFMEDVDYDEE